MRVVNLKILLTENAIGILHEAGYGEEQIIDEMRVVVKSYIEGLVDEILDDLVSSHQPKIPPVKDKNVKIL